MDKKLLPKNFFKDNPLDQLSAAQIAYFAMTTGFRRKISGHCTERSGRNACVWAQGADCSGGSGDIAIGGRGRDRQIHAFRL